jgi:alpha-mannosidase
VQVTEDKNEWRIHNSHLYVSISHDGTITSLSNGARNVLPVGQFPAFTLRNDRPAEYDAWDIDMADANAAPTMTLRNGVAALVEHSPMRAIVECSYATEASQFTVRYTISAGSPRLDIALDANWQEHEQRLQWCLPTDIHSREAVFGTQFGHVRRPRHANTSWDLAQFEVCGHRYASVHEPRFGVALLADGPRGYDVRGDELRLTVLRAPCFPDPFADRGRQKIEWSVMLTQGDPIVHGIEREAARITHPPRIVDGTPALTPLHIDLDIEGVMISAVKPADNDNGDIIIRLWETTGGRAQGTLSVPGFAVVSECDALEVPNGDAWRTADGAIQLTVEAFQIRTLRLSQ